MDSRQSNQQHALGETNINEGSPPEMIDTTSVEEVKGSQKV